MQILTCYLFEAGLVCIAYPNYLYIYVITYTHAQKLPPRQCVSVNSAPTCNVLYINAYFYSVILYTSLIIIFLVQTWPHVTLVSEVDDAMTDSSVNMDSAYKVVPHGCMRLETGCTIRKFTVSLYNSEVNEGAASQVYSQCISVAGTYR